MVDNDLSLVHDTTAVIAKDFDEIEEVFDSSVIKCKYLECSQVKNYIAENAVVKNNYLNMLHVNVRSLNKNFDELVNLIAEIEVVLPVIAVTETWLTVSNHDLYNMNGYNFVSQERIGRLGGGVGLFITKGLD